MSDDILVLAKKLLGEDKVDLSPESRGGLYSIGYSHFQCGKYREALVFFKLLAGIDISNRSYWKSLGATYQMLRDYEKAIEAYSIAAMTDRQETDPMPHFHAAQCLHSAGQLDRGLIALKSANTIAKKNKSFNSLQKQIKLLYKTWSLQLRGKHAD